jgi:nitroreductase
VNWKVLEMDIGTVDKLLTTTRAVRKRLDLNRPVEPEVIEKCLELAVQAPVGGFIPRYHFMIVTDPDKKARIAELYKAVYYGPYLNRREQQVKAFPDREERFLEVAGHLAEHLHEVPVHVIPCVEGRSSDPSTFVQASLYAQVLQAAWSFMLALRSRGLGTCWTTLHLAHEKEIAELLGIPEGVTQTALIPVAYYTGQDFRPARRLDARQKTSWNSWETRRDQ